jgi:hypothetical protein
MCEQFASAVILFPLEFGLLCQFAWWNPQNVVIYGLLGVAKAVHESLRDHALCDQLVDPYERGWGWNFRLDKENDH